MSLAVSSWAIRRPIPTLVLFLVLAVAGWVSFIDLPINANPRVDFPVITVAVVQVGAAPSELEHAVTQRVERAVSGLAGIRHITSTIADAISVTTVEFQLGIDPDRAANDIRDAIGQIRADLPQTIEEPLVTRVDVEGGAILNYAVKSSARNAVDLSWFVDDVLGRNCLAYPGYKKYSVWAVWSVRSRSNSSPSDLRHWASRPTRSTPSCCTATATCPAGGRFSPTASNPYAPWAAP